MAGRWVRVARVDDVAGDGPHAVAAEGLDLVVLRSGGALRAFEGRCPHQGALLGEGEIEGGRLVCRNHRWRFDAATGRRDGGPQCLRTCPVQVRGSELWVDIAPLAAGEARAVRRRIADLPGPRPWPVVGNLFHIDLARFHLVFEDWAREYGPLYRLDLGGRPCIGVSDPELIEQALRARPETYRREGRVEPVFGELGVAGVFSAEGDAWRPQRRLAMEALSQRNLRGFYPTLAAIAERLRRRWATAADREQELDLLDELMRFTVDVTTTLAFGCDLNTIDGGDDVIQRHLALVFPAFTRRLNALVPYWRLIRLPADRRVDRAIAALRRWIGDLIAQARTRLAGDRERPPRDFLEAMLAGRDDDGRPFSDEVLFGNVMTMLLAGEDTTANSLAWAVHLLCEHPVEVDAMRAELDAVLGDAAVPPDLEVANQLERATGVAHEAMRLQPVAPLNFIEATTDTVLGDLEIPRRTIIVTIHRIAAKDPHRFATPGEFRPARWLASQRRAGEAHDPSVFMPFGSGPRICPGRTLALVEMRVVLAMLYRNFDVSRVGSAAAVKERYAFTVGPSNLRVRLRRRASTAR